LLNKKRPSVSLSLNEPGWPNEFVSDYAPELTGYTAEELSDGSVMFGDLIVEEDRQRVWEEAQRALAGRRRFDLRYAIRRRDGELRHMEDNGQGVYDEEGHLEALEGIVYDVTEHERAEEKLRQAEERYRSLVETSPAITNIEDCDTNATLYDSSQIEEVLGHPADSYVTDPMYWEKIVHPDDRERVRTEELRSVQRGRFSMEYRCTAKDGRVVWLRDEATIVRDAEGNPRCWQGVLLDITELKRVEEALREAEARYRMLVVQVPAVTYIDGADETNTVIYRSPQIEAVLGYTPEELSSGSLSWQDLLHPDDRERVLEENERTNRTGEPFSIEYRMIATDGRVVWIRDEATLVRGDDGEPVYWQGVFTDITERKALEERLEHQALHDPLTGLPNRTLFMDRLGQALARSGRRNKSVAVLFLDLDDFKVINDSLGHEAGDELLVAVAARLRGASERGTPWPASGETSSPSCWRRWGERARRSGRRRGSRRCCERPSSSTGTSCSPPRASGSRSATPVRTGPRTCSATRTWRCRRPKRGARRATPCSSWEWTIAPPSA
jgi:PAS domain S-box-containing protein